MKIDLFEFETVPDGGADPGGGAPPDPGAAGGTPPAAGGDGGAAAGWGGPSQEEWQQTQQALQQMAGVAPFMQELQSLLADEGPPQYGYDPYGQQQQFDFSTPEGQQAYLDARIEQMYQERFGAFEPVLGQIAEREGEQRARAELDRLASEQGDFNRDLALIAAQQYVQTMPPDQALVAAAQYARQIREAERTAAIEEHQKALEAAANAPTELGAPGAATTLPTTATGRDRYEETLARFQSGLRPVNPAA